MATFFSVRRKRWLMYFMLTLLPASIVAFVMLLRVFIPFDTLSSDYPQALASAKLFAAFAVTTLFGINLFALGFYASIILTNNANKHFMWRAALTVLAVTVVFSKNNFLESLGASKPTIVYFVFTIFTHCALAFVPYMTINFLSSSTMLAIDNTTKKAYLASGIITFFVALGLGFSGYMHILGIVIILGLLPLCHIILQLYKLRQSNVKYVYTMSSATVYLLYSLLFEILTFSGLMPINLILISPIFLTISTILISAYFFRISMWGQSEATEAAQLRLSLRESEYSLMLSQIKPHFLYNALVAIEMLCTEDPASAATATRQFSEYLRANMRSITAKDPIPFLDEMHHVESYASIELLRFKNRLQFNANLEVTDFSVPPLTIQPLVENAIKHGACKNIKGGSVFVHSYETESFYIVEITDDGVGFNPCEKKAGESHGLSNIEMRLKHLMNAQIEIFSVIGEGTRAVVSIPK